MIPDPSHAGQQIVDPSNPGGTLPKVKKSDGTTPVWVYAAADGSVVPTDDEGAPKLATAKPQLFAVSYQGGVTKDPTSGIETFNYHDTAKSVVAPHKGGVHRHPGLYRHFDFSGFRIGHLDG